MTIQLDIQHACKDPLPFSDEQLSEWVHTALMPHRESAELTIRFVEPDEITHLNHTYRKKNKATNVLAFPSNLPDDVLLEYPLLGDVVVCPAVLKEESCVLNTPLISHWAHITIHGVLHLLGYDHIDKKDASIMEKLEIKALATLGFDNPYALEDS
ncbi:MAG: rRNA maturation RNase YbeY [Legionellaceae bacterium]|nr:rRNA maturation RNase YbeY [Legionellaceae bacterium]